MGLPRQALHFRSALHTYNNAGERAPRILRRFGITEDNRRTLSLGMTLDQSVNRENYRPYERLWKSQSPPGERLNEYADKEWPNKPLKAKLRRKSLGR